MVSVAIATAFSFLSVESRFSLAFLSCIVSAIAISSVDMFFLVVSSFVKSNSFDAVSGTEILTIDVSFLDCLSLCCVYSAGTHPLVAIKMTTNRKNAIMDFLFIIPCKVTK